MEDIRGRDYRLRPRKTLAGRRFLEGRGYGAKDAAGQIEKVTAQLLGTPAANRIARPEVPPIPDAVDTGAALSLIAESRAMLDRQEMELIGHSRAEGVPWEIVADVLGLHSGASAQRRFAGLRRSFPDYCPPRELLRQWLPANRQALYEAAASLLAYFADLYTDACLMDELQRVAELRLCEDEDSAIELYWTLYPLIASCEMEDLLHVPHADGVMLSLLELLTECGTKGRQ